MYLAMTMYVKWPLVSELKPFIQDYGLFTCHGYKNKKSIRHIRSFLDPF